MLLHSVLFVFVVVIVILFLFIVVVVKLVTPRCLFTLRWPPL